MPKENIVWTESEKLKLLEAIRILAVSPKYYRKINHAFRDAMADALPKDRQRKIGYVMYLAPEMQQRITQAFDEMQPKNPRFQPEDALASGRAQSYVGKTRGRPKGPGKKYVKYGVPPDLMGKLGPPKDVYSHGQEETPEEIYRSEMGKGSEILTHPLSHAIEYTKQHVAMATGNPSVVRCVSGDIALNPIHQRGLEMYEFARTGGDDFTLSYIAERHGRKHQYEAGRD